MNSNLKYFPALYNKQIKFLEEIVTFRILSAFVKNLVRKLSSSTMWFFKYNQTKTIGQKSETLLT